jgi:hypothetical protein
MTDEPDNTEILRRAIAHAAPRYALKDVEGAIVLGGDLFNQVRIVGTRAIGVPEALSSLRRAKPFLFATATEMTAQQRALVLREIAAGPARAFDKRQEDAKIAAIKQQQGVKK